MTVVEWDREREIVRFAGGAAGWNPAWGDPFTQPVCLTLSWHSGSESGVAVVALVVETRQLYLAVDSLHPELPARREETRKVSALEQFPSEVLAEDGSVLEPIGALVTIGDLVLREPTLAEVATERAVRDRGRRTVQITGPAPAFGDRVPGCGDFLRIDLDDDRLDVSGAPDRPTGIVVGLTQQVSAMCAVGRMIGEVGMVAFTDVDHGQPASSIPDRLFVVLVIDEETR